MRAIRSEQPAQTPGRVLRASLICLHSQHVEWSGTVNRSVYLGNAAACPTKRAVRRAKVLCTILPGCERRMHGARMTRNHAFAGSRPSYDQSQNNHQWGKNWNLHDHAESQRDFAVLFLCDRGGLHDVTSRALHGILRRTPNINGQRILDM
jgi:hypothetical protein